MPRPIAGPTTPVVDDRVAGPALGSLRSGAMLPQDWIEHRRGDGEVLGWMYADGEGFRVFDLLGRERTPGGPDGEPLEWLAAEELLDELGIGYLADRWTLRLPDGAERPVRIAEASARGVTVVADEFGAASAVGADPERFRLPFPVTGELSPR
ncbi:hypothetical protein GCM10025760_00020 [Microbacterium yannicii]|uniref:Uncharacterized protein n=1 Tax=Microbacterium yannicii TaxID=671622 RepID=A0ABP9LQM3_9MICO|nr:hypothetical protein [Microbacterium yannicii]MCO5952343.1 hypothetical protein [Microbacterium yannicii]